MKYIKRFKKINEANGYGDLDYSDFKHIMSIVTDNYDNVHFDDYSNEDYGFYDCWINQEYLEVYDEIDNVHHFSYVINPTDDPGSFEKVIEDGIISEIDNQIKTIKNIKFDTIIKQKEDFKNLILTIEDNILPKLQSYDNYEDCYIGYDNGQIRITFQIK